MGRWHDRYGLACDVDAQFRTTLQDVREVLVQEVRAFVADVQIDAVQALLFHFKINRPRHHVARRKFGARVVLRHEAGAVGQQQQAAFSAHGLADQKGFGVRVVQAGRVELDELHVLHPAAGTPGCGDTVSGGRVRIGGVQVNLAGTARGQDGVRCGERLDAVLAFIQGVEANALARRPARAGPVCPGAAVACGAGRHGTRDQVDQHVPVEDSDVGCRQYMLDQFFLYCCASGVRHVHDAALAVAAFACQVQCAVFFGESHAQ